MAMGSEDRRGGAQSECEGCGLCGENRKWRCNGRVVEICPTQKHEPAHSLLYGMGFRQLRAPGPQGSDSGHTGLCRTGYRWLGNHSGVGHAELTSPFVMVFALSPFVTHTDVRLGDSWRIN